MLEILGYEGFFFLPDGNNFTVPWRGLILPKVNILYFSDVAINHAPMDMMSSELLSQIIRLANYRGESNDCVVGLQMAIEVMAGSLWRHQRRARAGNPPYVQPHVFVDAYAQPDARQLLYGGAGLNAPQILALPNRAFTRRTNPRGQDYIGDMAVADALGPLMAAPQPRLLPWQAGATRMPTAVDAYGVQQATVSATVTDFRSPSMQDPKPQSAATKVAATNPTATAANPHKPGKKSPYNRRQEREKAKGNKPSNHPVNHPSSTTSHATSTAAAPAVPIVAAPAAAPAAVVVANAADIAAAAAPAVPNQP